MKYQIRQGMFETNSSSTHAVCIPKDRNYKDELPEKLDFEINTWGYGWEYDTLYSTYEKANYLYAMILTYSDSEEELDEYIEKISSILNEYDVKAVFEERESDVNEYFLIDHGDLGKCLNGILETEDSLMSYLFGDSIVITGNDNSDTWMDRMYGEGLDHWDFSVFAPEFDDYDVYIKSN